MSTGRCRERYAVPPAQRACGPDRRSPALPGRRGDRHRHGGAIGGARRRGFSARPERRADALHRRAVGRRDAAAARVQRAGDELRARRDPAARDGAGVLRRRELRSAPRPRGARRAHRRGRLLRHRQFPDRHPDRRRVPALPGERRPRLRARARTARASPRRAAWSTLAYAHTRDEAVAAAQRGVDIVNIDLGWNKGGVRRRRHDRAHRGSGADRQRDRARGPRQSRRRRRCVVEGGPIVNPHQLEELCQIARVDGYIGGSTIDRVPSESAIEIVTAAFKAIGTLQQRIDGLERRLDPRRRFRAAVGPFAAVENARALFARLCDDRSCGRSIVGEPGTGRREVARALHRARARARRAISSASRATTHPPSALRLDLFGCMAGAHPTVAQEPARLARDRARVVAPARRRRRPADRNAARPARGGRNAAASGVCGSDRHAARRALSRGLARSDLREARASAVDPRFAEWLGCFTHPCCRRCASGWRTCRR